MYISDVYILLLALADDDVVAFGDDDINTDIMRLGIDFVDKLEIVTHPHLTFPTVGQQPVVIAFTATDAVADAVIGHSRDYYHLHIADRSGVVAGRLFDVKRAKSKPGFIVGENLEIHTVDTRKIEMLTATPLADEFMCRQFIRE